MTDLKTAKTPETYFNDLYALARIDNPASIEKTLEYAISPNMRSQDAPYLISSMMRNPTAAKQAWSFVQAHWSAIENLG